MLEWWPSLALHLHLRTRLGHKAEEWWSPVLQFHHSNLLGHLLVLLLDHNMPVQWWLGIAHLEAQKNLVDPFLVS